MRRIAFVFAGGGIGTCLRAGVIDSLFGWAAPFPAAVLAINLVGAFGLGMFYVFAVERGLLHPDARLFIAVGVLGGFTTFSTFAWEADILAADRHIWLSGLYIMASTMGGMVTAMAGISAGRWLAIGHKMRHGRATGDGYGDVDGDRIGVIELEDRDERE